MAQATTRIDSISTETVPQNTSIRLSVDVENAPSIAKRLTALDAFRGLTICLMLLVNNVALDEKTPKELMHAPWNLGMTLADLVFPWFLFCVGVALPFSRASFAKSKKSQFAYLGKAFLRAGALVIIGVLLDSAINHRLGFALGVLQLIGLAYFVAAVAYEARLWVRVVFATVLLATYGFAFRHISFAGSPAGLFEESNNWAHHINSTYLEKYQLRGLLSTIPTAALVLYGSLVGDVLRDPKADPIKKLLGILVSAIALIALGDIWNVFLPFNKPLWTPSYILVTGGIGALILASIYVVVDLGRQRWLAYPFRIFGSNAILAYVAPILVKVMILQIIVVQTKSGSQNLQKAIIEWLKGNYGNVPGGWAYTGAYIFFWWLVLWVLYQRKLFLRV